MLNDNRTGVFQASNKKTRVLVVGNDADALGDYVQAKMANYLGHPLSTVTAATTFQIDAGYANSEGVIKKMQDEIGFVAGLRLDLQAPQTHANVEYATFQVQFGTGMGNNGGALAGALVRLGQSFTLGELNQALKNSFASQSYWRVD